MSTTLVQDAVKTFTITVTGLVNDRRFSRTYPIRATSLTQAREKAEDRFGRDYPDAEEWEAL